LGRTVEKYSKTSNTKKGIQRSSTSLNLALGGNWVGLLKNTLKTKHKKGITKEHITQQSLLYRWNCRLLKNTNTSNTMKESQREQHITNLLLYR
jgi:hypothetical protein